MHITPIELADQLGINEFELFEKAYTYWYGKKPILVKLESDFAKYMINQCYLPIYVKGYISRPYFLIA